MKCLIYWRLGQQTTYRKLILTWGLNRQNVNVEWKYKTDTDSKHTFGDITYHLPGTSLFSYLRAVQTAFISFGEKAASLDISNLTLVGSLIHSNFIISFSLSCVSPPVWIPLERLQDRGIGWRGRWEGGSGWGTHVNPWLFHFNVWQNPLQ